MNQGFSTAGMNLDQSSTNTNDSSEALNEPTTIGNELVPHAQNDENGASLSQDGVCAESNRESHTCKGGPRTAKGKADASRNALKHGIFSSVLLLISDSRKRYDSLLSGLREHFKPETTIEEVLVEKLAVLIWRYRRLISTEKAEIKEGASPLQGETSISDSSILNRFPRYEASIERGFDRTLTQLERIQRMRRGQSVPPPIKVDISS
jgi:hypothetical protein